MIIKVKDEMDAKVCDDFLTLLIQDERKYDKSIEEDFVCKDYFVQMINDENILLLYKVKDENAGYVFLKRISDGYLIDGLYVDISFRGRGISKELISEAIHEIELKGNYKVFIKVWKENIIAYNLYKSFGFEVVSEEDNKYYMELNRK